MTIHFIAYQLLARLALLAQRVASPVGSGFLLRGLAGGAGFAGGQHGLHQALALAVARGLAALPEGDLLVEVGVDLVVDPEGRPHPIEVNGKPRGRLEILAEHDAAWREAASRIDVLIGSTTEETRLYVPLIPAFARMTSMPLVGNPIRRVLVDTGAVDRVEDLITALADDACRALDRARDTGSYDALALDVLEALVAVSTARRS